MDHTGGFGICSSLQSRPVLLAQPRHRLTRCKGELRSVWLDEIANRALRLQEDVERKRYIVALPARRYPTFHPGDDYSILLDAPVPSIDDKRFSVAARCGAELGNKGSSRLDFLSSSLSSLRERLSPELTAPHIHPATTLSSPCILTSLHSHLFVTKTSIR